MKVKNLIVALFIGAAAFASFADDDLGVWEPEEKLLMNEKVKEVEERSGTCICGERGDHIHTKKELEEFEAFKESRKKSVKDFWQEFHEDFLD